jgi:hypothetical protein
MGLVFVAAHLLSIKKNSMNFDGRSSSAINSVVLLCTESRILVAKDTPNAVSKLLRRVSVSGSIPTPLFFLHKIELSVLVLYECTQRTKDMGEFGDLPSFFKIRGKSKQVIGLSSSGKAHPVAVKLGQATSPILLEFAGQN